MSKVQGILGYELPDTLLSLRLLTLLPTDLIGLLKAGEVVARLGVGRMRVGST